MRKKKPSVNLQVKPDASFLSKLRTVLTGSKPVSVQETIPYISMHKNGICRLSENNYSQTITFDDIQYQLATEDDKRKIFTEWCSVLNYFTQDIPFELTFVNSCSLISDIKEITQLPSKDDGLNKLRDEHSAIISDKATAGNNGIHRAKYRTFSLYDTDEKSAARRLTSNGSAILKSLKDMDVTARSLNGTEWLESIHMIMHPLRRKKFNFQWKWLSTTGNSTKDYIVPKDLKFFDTYITHEGQYSSCSGIFLPATELEDSFLADILAINCCMTVSIHVKPIDRKKALKIARTTYNDLQSMKVEEQKKAVRSGYDMDILPAELEDSIEEAKEQLKNMRKNAEKMMIVSIVIMNTASSPAALKKDVAQVASVADLAGFELYPLRYSQEEAFQSVLPLGVNALSSYRSMDTSSLAGFMPFTANELLMPGGQYYGINALTKNLIIADRKKLKNPNGLIFGVPGSGKGMFAKSEITDVLLRTDDDIIISDPEGEYSPLVKLEGGQVITLSTISGSYVNPLDINLNYDEEDPVAFKCDFILSLCELVASPKTGLDPLEVGIIDRCVKKIYMPYMENQIPSNQPILEDLYNTLLEQNTPESVRIANALEIYVHGSLNYFNHRTNVKLDSRLVSYNFKPLGKQLKKIGMLVMQDQVWNRVTTNRQEKRYTWFYDDEFHLRLKEPQTAAFATEIWKRFRKWGGIPTGITQNVKDLLRSDEIEDIFENSKFFVLLDQADGDRTILAEKLKISNTQLSYIENADEGCGLLFYGHAVVPFEHKIPEDTMLYKAMTTKLEEVGN